MKLLFATTNQGKLQELQSLVAGLAIEVVSLREVPVREVDEDRDTFAGNAEKKALAYADSLSLATLADDTGLCVDALDGAPGVRSARYAGVEGEAALGDASARYRANNARLLRELEGVPPERRTARFRCAICFAVPGRPPVTVEGSCEGRILDRERGAHGFGYDPLFEVTGLGKTLAEVGPEEKNRISHRARAFEAIRPSLAKWAADGA